MGKKDKKTSVVKSCILLFTKFPQKGLVKSRISIHLDETTTLTLYKSFVSDTLQLVNQLNYNKIICYTPTNSLQDFKSWLGSQYHYLPQKGVNLGQRISNSFQYAFTHNYQYVIALGTDSPDLPAHYIHEGFYHLAMGNVVIGPSTDGGYYLIGLNKENFFPRLFENIPWSTQNVFHQTLEIVKDEKLKSHVLPTWYDIDTLKDLYELYARNTDGQFKSSSTMKHLNTIISNNKIPPMSKMKKGKK